LTNLSPFFNISIVGLSAIADFLAVDDDPAITDVHDVISSHGPPLVVVYAVAGNLFVVGPTVTHIHAVALVHSDAGTHSVAGVSAVNSSIQLHDVTA
jgi:hypothetical protein